MCTTNDTDINYESLKKRSFKIRIVKKTFNSSIATKYSLNELKMIEGLKKISIHKSQIWNFFPIYP